MGKRPAFPRPKKPPFAFQCSTLTSILQGESLQKFLLKTFILPIDASCQGLFAISKSLHSMIMPLGNLDRPPWIFEKYETAPLHHIHLLLICQSMWTPSSIYRQHTPECFCRIKSAAADSMPRTFCICSTIIRASSVIRHSVLKAAEFSVEAAVTKRPVRVSYIFKIYSPLFNSLHHRNTFALYEACLYQTQPANFARLVLCHPLHEVIINENCNCAFEALRRSTQRSYRAFLAEF